MGPYLSLYILISLYAFSGVLIGSYGSLLVLIAPYKSL